MVRHLTIRICIKIIVYKDELENINRIDLYNLEYILVKKIVYLIHNKASCQAFDNVKKKYLKKVVVCYY